MRQDHSDIGDHLSEKGMGAALTLVRDAAGQERKS